MKALDELIAQKLPRLAQHMTDLEADISILATDWYLTLFATSMPAETVARVWDGLFNEGPKVLFRTALALLKSQEAALLKYDNAGDPEGCLHVAQRFQVCCLACNTVT